MDGTITDPRDAMLTCMRFALAEVRCECPPDDEIVRYIGPPLREALRAIVGDGNDAKLSLALERFRDRYASGGILENTVYPGIPEALESLREAGARLFLATSKPTVYATRILQHCGLGDLFTGVHGSDLDGTRANKAELIGHVLHAESLDPVQCLMIGDRSQDIVGARANGVASIGALWGYGSREELSAAGATALCEHPSMLFDAVFNGLGPRLRGGD